MPIRKRSILVSGLAVVFGAITGCSATDTIFNTTQGFRRGYLHPYCTGEDGYKLACDLECVSNLFQVRVGRDHFDKAKCGTAVKIYAENRIAIARVIDECTDCTLDGSQLDLSADLYDYLANIYVPEDDDPSATTASMYPQLSGKWEYVNINN
ncbi:hypothetical protein PNOK_0149900 [Pyrrhoderma noxium]|uniref:RlpA-like protein double-psi beta-barrel domain-containing protein n=1 Tax=Pyrrhoderma noxium TaxID=2282107 RepID=A0A286UPN6_9AGAM|nr:hypothetical protein PNOK_0149900 [Pyrrhoderma noxium]